MDKSVLNQIKLVVYAKKLTIFFYWNDCPKLLEWLELLVYVVEMIQTTSWHDNINLT